MVVVVVVVVVVVTTRSLVWSLSHISRVNTNSAAVFGNKVQSCGTEDAKIIYCYRLEPVGYTEDRVEYFCVFLVAAIIGHCTSLWLLCQRRKQVTTVTSQTNERPPCHGIKVSPSGRLPSCLSSPEGSLTAGIPAAPTARQMISLKTWCLAILPGVFLQTMAWRPWASTKVPQWQLCGTHKLSPSLIPTATLTASSSRRKPQLAIGRARSQSPLCGACAARNLALCDGSTSDACTVSLKTRSVPEWLFLAEDQVVDQPMRTTLLLFF